MFVKLIAIAEKILFMRSHFLNWERIVELVSESTLNVQVITEGNDVWVKIKK
jgi:hypothetical protein